AARRPRQRRVAALRAVRSVAPSTSSPGHRRGTAPRVPAWVRRLLHRHRRGASGSASGSQSALQQHLSQRPL
ncbi:hypothetical protein MTO96_038709, partial [Rhipicephalus appendiculatus]